MIAIVDDDLGMREAIAGLLRAHGFATECYASAEVFLLAPDQQRTRCLILDVALPGLSGPQLQQHLARRGFHIPIIFISAHADFAAHVHAPTPDSHADFLSKPFTEAQLLRALEGALHRCAATAAS